jgi:uncharacterized protein YbjQ (UPF0145 family)
MKTDGVLLPVLAIDLLASASAKRKTNSNNSKAFLSDHQSQKEDTMKKAILAAFIGASLLAVVCPADARDTKYLLPIETALAVKDAQDKLDGSIKFFFGNQTTPPILAKLGTDVSNRKTNAFGKSDEKACNWAFLSAMVALEKRAQQLGANAVVNIVSYYKKDVMTSATEFECHAGAVIAGVALKGDFVKIADK